MALDNAQYPSELSITDPPGNDPVGQADDQIRTSKRVVKQGFPNITAPMTASEVELNYAVGVTSAIQAQIDTKAPIAAPVFTSSIAIGSAVVNESELEILDNATIVTSELNRLDGVTSNIQAQIDGRALLAGDNTQRFDVESPNDDDQAIRRDTFGTQFTGGTIKIWVTGGDTLNIETS